jgi:hypothetical protein
MLQIAGPPAILEGGFGLHERDPAWTLSSDDGAQVTLLVSRQAAEGPSGSDFPISVAHTTFEPWVDFPSGQILGPLDLADDEGGGSFAAARSPGDRFALLFDDPLPPNGGLVFSNGFVPFTSQAPTLALVDGTAKDALFAAQGKDGHLVGTQRVLLTGGGNVYRLGATFAGEDGSLAGPTELACASGEMHADAVGAGDGWLMAMSNGGPFGGPECLEAELGWPDEVQIVVAGPSSFANTDYFGAPGGATEVKMAPASGGAWVIAGTPPGQVTSGTFIGARLDLDGKILFTFPVTIGDPNQEQVVSGTLAAAGVGDHLVVAWVDFGGDKGPFLRVRAFDPGGNAAGHVEIFPFQSFSGAPALLGSPLTGSAVLAWSETPDQGQGDGDKIRAVRIDCFPEP